MTYQASPQLRALSTYSSTRRKTNHRAWEFDLKSFGKMFRRCQCWEAWRCVTSARGGCSLVSPLVRVSSSISYLYHCHVPGLTLAETSLTPCSWIPSFLPAVGHFHHFHPHPWGVAWSWAHVTSLPSMAQPLVSVGMPIPSFKIVKCWHMTSPSSSETPDGKMSHLNSSLVLLWIDAAGTQGSYLHCCSLPLWSALSHLVLSRLGWFFLVKLKKKKKPKT